MTKKVQRYLRFLAQEAKEQAAASRCRLCAMIVYKNMPISLGKNQMKSHPAMLDFGRTEHHIYLHAEIDAILKATKELTPAELAKSTLYVVRVLANGQHAEAKPCPGCQRAIKEYGIENVVWTTYNGYATSEEHKLDETNVIYETRKAANAAKYNSVHISACGHTATAS